MSQSHPLRALLEVADGDVRPNVSVKINQDRVQTNEILEEFTI